MLAINCVHQCRSSCLNTIEDVALFVRTRPAFIAWAVGISRNRANWQLTTLKQSRNVLRLITVMAVE